MGGKAIDFGIYINADDIARVLLDSRFEFSDYQVAPLSRTEFEAKAQATGLLEKRFDLAIFRQCYRLGRGGAVHLKRPEWNEHFAQVLAQILRESLLDTGHKLSFETVMSHPSKLEFMKRARACGYKVYLYFVCTEDPLINIERIKKVRVKLGGHDVPAEKIRWRYQRSLELLFDASELADQAYFFDNSSDVADQAAEPFAHFKTIAGEQYWEIDDQRIPHWFEVHYLDKL